MGYTVCLGLGLIAGFTIGLYVAFFQESDLVKGGESVAKIWLPDDFEIPKECHECPFQLRYKDGEVDDWYIRRCVIMGRTIEYPKPKWCPIIDDIKVTSVQT